MEPSIAEEGRPPTRYRLPGHASQSRQGRFKEYGAIFGKGTPEFDGQFQAVGDGKGKGTGKNEGKGDGKGRDKGKNEGKGHGKGKNKGRQS